MASNKSFYLVFIPIFLRALSPVFFKQAAISLDEYSFWEIALNVCFWISILIFFLRALSWQFILRIFPLSAVYPLTAFSLGVVLFIGYFFFNEPVPLHKLIGFGFIVMGIVFMSRSKNIRLKIKND